MGRITSGLEVVVGGFGFPEGPVGLPDGRLAFTDMRLQSVFAISGSSATLVARTIGSPNGATLGWDGALYVANNGGIAPGSSEDVWYSTPRIDGCIQRLMLDGGVEQVDTGPLPGSLPHRPKRPLLWAGRGPLLQPIHITGRCCSRRPLTRASTEADACSGRTCAGGRIYSPSCLVS